jgi:hypothetical protein
MKAQHILIYLGMLALLLVVALMSGRIQDESRRLEFTTWVPIAIVVAVIAARYFFSGRSNRVPAEPTETRRETVPAEEPANNPAHPLSIRPVLRVVAIAGAFLIGSWLCLLYLGSVGGPDLQSTAQMCLHIVTSAVTTIAAVLLSKLEIARRSRTGRVFQLAALLQIVLAFVGLLVLPLVGLVVWNDYVDFRAYSPGLGFFLMLPPMAAVIFCMTRAGGSKK